MLTILSIVIGLIFVILLMSILASTVHDVLNSTFSLRAKNLRSTLSHMLGEEAKPFFDHPFFQQIAFAERHKKDDQPYALPEKISKETFSAVFHDLLTQKKDGAGNLGSKIAQLDDPKLRKLLEYLARQSDGTEGGFKDKIEGWYDEMMARNSKWFERATRWRLLGIGIVLAFLLNADTIMIYKSLAANSALRDQLVEQAEALAKRDTASLSLVGKTPEETLRNLEAFYGQNVKPISSPLGLGWNDDRSKENLPDWLTKIAGILLMGIAVSMGAAFWYDLLKKTVSLKSGFAGGSLSKNEKTAEPAAKNEETEKAPSRKTDDQKPIGPVQKTERQPAAVAEKNAEKAAEKSRIIAAEKDKKPFG